MTEWRFSFTQDRGAISHCEWGSPQRNDHLELNANKSWLKIQIRRPHQLGTSNLSWIKKKKYSQFLIWGYRISTEVYKANIGV